jgi:hypothetical protein
VPAADPVRTGRRAGAVAQASLEAATLNAIDKAGFSFSGLPKTNVYLEALRARPAWKETPKLPMP